MFDYRKRLAWSKLKVGAVVTIAIGILFLAILFAGNIQRLFVSEVSIAATFRDVKGLRAGAPVWFAGVQIGSVKSIRFAREQIIATITIERDALPYLKKDSEASILTLGLLGDKYIEVSPGSKESAGLKPGDAIAGISAPGIDEELSRLVNKVESRKGSLGRLLSEDTLYRELSLSVRDIRVFAQTLRDSRGTVANLMKDPAIYENFLKASRSLDTFAEQLAKSKGTLNRLVEDEALYENMNAAASKLNTILDKISRGEGAAGSLVTDKELKADLQGTIKELNALVKDMKEHPGRYFKVSIF